MMFACRTTGLPVVGSMPWVSLKMHVSSLSLLPHGWTDCCSSSSSAFVACPFAGE
jgi:hypothetical protein